MTRVTRNIGDRSTVGGIFTERSREGYESERLYGLDVDFKPTQRLEFSGFWAVSDRGVPDSEQEANETRGAGFIYQGPELSLTGDYVEV